MEIQEIIEKSFPAWVSLFLTEATKSIDCDPSYTLTSFLALASTCIGNSSRVEPKLSWTESAGIYSAIVGGPSEKKSPAIKTINLPLDEIQKELEISYETDIDEYNLICSDGAPKGRPPIYQSVFTTDTTMEALAVALKDNYHGVLIRKDELNHFFKSMNAYRNGGGDLETVLELYNNGLITINRKGTERPIVVDNPFLTIIGGLQEKPFKEVFSNDTVGLKERFIYAFSNLKREKRVFSYFEISELTMFNYVKNTKEIYWDSFFISKKGVPNIYKLNEQAKSFWIKWQEGLPTMTELDAMYDKSIARAVRISLILEIFNNPKRELMEISLNSMQSAVLLTEFYIENHKKAVEIFEDKDISRKLEKTLEWVKKSYTNPRMIKFVNEKDGIAIRSFYNNNVAGVRTASEARGILELLEEKGYGLLIKNHKIPNTPEIFWLAPRFRQSSTLQ